MDPDIRYYPADDRYHSASTECTAETVFYDVIKALTCAELSQVLRTIDRCWLTDLIDQVLLERGLQFDYSALGA